MGNTQRGIEVTTGGSVNITGVATTPPTGNGTVITSGNTDAGLYINQTPGTTGLGTNTITGLVSWNNNTYGGRFFGGSKVKVRSSVFGANAQFGVLISNAGAGGTAAQRLDVSAIDLGTAVDFGNNWVQTTASVLGHNTNAGLCVNLGNNTATGTLQAAGNEMITGPFNNQPMQSQVNCATTAATVTKNNNTTCTNGVAYGKAANTTVTTVLSNCN